MKKNWLRGVTVLCLCVCFILILIVAPRHSVEVNIARVAKTRAHLTTKGARLSEGGSVEFVNDNVDRDNYPNPPVTFWSGPVSPKEANWIELNWKKEHIISSVAINFGKGGYGARDYNIQIGNSEELVSWENIIVVNGNDQSSVTHNLSNITTDKLRIYITKAQSNELVRIIEFYVYEKLPVHSAFLLYVLSPYMSNIFFSFLFFIILFLPGYTILNSFPISLNQTEKFALSFAITISLIFAFSLLGLMTGIYSWMLLIMLVFTSLLAFLKRRIYLKLREVDQWMLIFTGLCFSFFLFSGMLYDSFKPSYGGDYIIPYAVSKVFMHHLPLKSEETVGMLWGYHVSDRTPLLSLVSIPFLNLFGESFATYRMFARITNNLLFPSLFLFLNKLFSRKVTIATLFFILLCSQYVYLPFAVPNKVLSTYFVFLFLYFVLRDDYLKPGIALLSSGLASLGFLSHQASLFFISGGIVYLFIRRGNWKRKFSNIAFVSSIFIVISLIWVWWSLSYDRLSRTAMHSLMPDGIYIGTIFTGSQSEIRLIMQEFFSYPFQKHLSIKLWNFLGLFIKDPKSFKGLSSLLSPSFYGMVPGAIMLSLFFFTLYFFIRNFGRYKIKIISLVGVPIFFYLFILGYYDTWGQSYFFLYPITPFLIGMGVQQILYFKHKIIVVVLYNLYLIEHLLVSRFVMGPYFALGISDIFHFRSLLIIAFFSLIFWYVLNEALFLKYLRGSSSNAY